MKIILSFLCSILTIALSAQSNLYKLTPLSLTDLQGFKNPPAQWQIVGNITASMNDEVLKGQAGTGVLFDNLDKTNKLTGNKNLFTNFEHSDLYLEMDFMMPKGSNAGVYLQGRYEIQLFDSWGVQHPKHSDCGGIYQRWIEETKTGYEGHPPRVNACFAPGLWQHLVIEFQAPRFDAEGKKVQNAVMKKVVLNDITIHENVILTGPTRASAGNEKPVAPLMLQGDHGQVAFRNIKYALLGDYKPTVKDISYAYYEGEFSDFDKLTADKLTRKGTTPAIDCRLADNGNKMGLLFNGTFDIDETGDYQWIIKQNGWTKLSIDGKEIVPPTEAWQEESTPYTSHLEKGTHTFTLGYIKNVPWRKPLLGLFLIKPNKRPFALHSPTSMPDPQPVPQIAVRVENYPKMQRHFAEHGGKKKTHVISVGNPQGVHFMYDLDQAGLMEVWKGDFLDATEMWYQRGEPQTAEAMGSGVILAGRCPIALIADNNAHLPDTLDPTKSLIFKGYSLDSVKNPTFKFNENGVLWTEKYANTEGGKGLKRSIKASNPTGKKLLYRLAEGGMIADLGNGLYVIDNQKYYVQLDATDKATIRTNKDKKELVIEKNDKETAVSYTIYF